MKVGIISMQRVCNNGSFLQAYGLKKLIESFGHEVVFVDYHTGDPLAATSKDRLNCLILKCRNKFVDLFTDVKFLRFLLPAEMRNIAVKRDEYKHQILPMLGIKDKRYYNTKVDALVIGSDEVFNCTQFNPEVGYSLELFGKDANADKVLSYAASFGNTTYQKLLDFGKADEVAGCLKRFNSISVRDRNSSEVVEKLLGVKPDVNLDPVLIYDFMPNVADKEQRRNYIVVYAYRARITTKEAEDIKAFAKKESKKLISVSGEMDWCDEHFKGNPFEVLDLFRHADYAITDTFHGTIFSIINRIRFVTLIRKSKGSSYGNQEKLQDLLNRLELQERSYSNEEQNLNTCISKDIDYNIVFKIIHKEREHTMQYLRKQLV
jgi:hypothetical protein